MTNEEKMMQLLEEINTRLIKVEITQENTVVPRIQALAEGVSAINDKLIARSEIEALKEEVSFLRDIIRMHTAQINDLKKAQ